MTYLQHDSAYVDDGRTIGDGARNHQTPSSLC